MNRIRLLGFTIGMLPVLAAWGSAVRADESGAPFFEKKIRPVLVKHCYKCHSTGAQRANKLKGGLLLDTRAGIRKGGESGPAIIPGKGTESLIVKALRFESLEMPPTGKLPNVIVTDFVKWIEMGAPGPRVDKPGNAASDASNDTQTALQFWAFQQPKKPSPPTILDASWPQNGFDRFILAKLEANGMHPSPPADKRVLLRRATFGLTGLPPTSQEIGDFLADDSVDAYSQLIERLLASPRYGERWGRHWLDAARYADTKGYVYDDREEFRFVHSSTYRDWVIRAFNEDLPYDRFLLYQIAGDQVRDKQGQRPLAAMGLLTLGQRFANVQQEIINDRIDTVTRATMALTVGCARCHDHPADPISMADYYSLYGVFSGSTERMLAIDRAAERTEAEVAWETELRKRKKAYEDYFRQKTAELLENLRAMTPAYLVSVLEAGTLPPDEFYLVLGKNDIRPFLVRRWEQYIHQEKFRKGIHAIFGAWHACAVIPESELAARVPAWLNANANRLNPRVAEVFQDRPPASMRDVAARYGEVFDQVLEQWQTAQQNKSKSLSDPADEDLRQVLYGSDSPIAAPTGAFSEIEWFYEESVRVGLGQKWREIERWIIQSEASYPHAVFMEDRELRREPRIFKRGNPANPGEVVPRRTLLIVGGVDRRPFRDGSGRLELARSIISPNNPLTARVLVNRVWQHHFGEGLVSTPSNFGRQGDRPSHPGLLDWLARRFMADGWSIKTLHRRIMLSSAYLQNSADNAAFRQIDPKNRFVWRMSRRRLDFEALRDSVLAVSEIWTSGWAESRSNSLHNPTALGGPYTGQSIG